MLFLAFVFLWLPLQFVCLISLLYAVFKVRCLSAFALRLYIKILSDFNNSSLDKKIWSLFTKLPFCLSFFPSHSPLRGLLSPLHGFLQKLLPGLIFYRIS